MPICLAFAALAALLPVTARAADVDVSTVVNSAAKVFAADPAFVGASIGVLRNGKESTFNFGSMTREGNHRPTARTLYPIASITKTFTGSLLATEAIEGKLSLEDDVRKYLRGNFANLEFDGHPVRLRDLLNHRSGLPFVLPDRPDLLPGYQAEPIERFVQRLDEAWRDYTRADFLADLGRVRLDGVPGEKFRYSNAAAQLAGYVLENIEGVTFDQLLQQKLARPLGMHDTAIVLTASQRKKLARGYEGTISLPPPNETLQAAGGLKSTVADMLNYLRWHAEEKAAGGRVVAPTHVPPRQLLRRAQLADPGKPNRGKRSSPPHLAGRQSAGLHQLSAVRAGARDRHRRAHERIRQIDIASDLHDVQRHSRGARRAFDPAAIARSYFADFFLTFPYFFS